MRNVLLILFVAIFAILPLPIVALNLHHLTTPILIYAGVSELVAVALALPANAKDALGAIAPYLPFGKGSSQGE